jgi:ribosomal protein S21
VPTVVKKKPGDSDDKLIAAFRKKVLADDIINELKKREFYQKPSRVRYEKKRVLKTLHRRSN